MRRSYLLMLGPFLVCAHSLAGRILHQLVCELRETGMMEAWKPEKVACPDSACGFDLQVQPSMGLFSEGASLDMRLGYGFSNMANM